jgi:hypothetical protein
MGAGRLAESAAGAVLRLDENHTIITLYNRLELALLNAGRIIAMMAQFWNVGHLYLWDLTPDVLVDTDPELSGVGLGFGIGGPIVGDVFILAAYLTTITAVADG